MIGFAFFACLIASRFFSTAEAQNSPSGTTAPSRFPGFAGQPDKFLERLFGESTAEEVKMMEDVDIPIKEERDFGRAQVEAYLAHLDREGHRVIRKGKDVEYLKHLVETLKPMMSHARRYPKITVYVVDSLQVDARSFPGGTLFFFKGLLSFAENEAALIGIVGHELSHLDHGHILLPLKRTKLMERTLADGAAAFDAQKFWSSGTALTRLMGRPFRPEDEAAADRDGARWSYQAGYDPRELAALFYRLHQRNKSPKLPMAAFFRTHPYSDDRHDAIMRQYDELQQADPRDTLYRGKKNLAQRIPRSQQEFPD